MPDVDRPLAPNPRQLAKLHAPVVKELPQLRGRLTQEALGQAVVRSVAHRFRDGAAEAPTVVRYVASLHGVDLGLAAYAAGDDAAWDHFVITHRPILYRAARAMTKDETAARYLADTLWAELYGVGSTRASIEAGTPRRSLLENFHSRSKLSTWLLRAWRNCMSTCYVNASGSIHLTGTTRATPVRRPARAAGLPWRPSRTPTRTAIGTWPSSSRHSTRRWVCWSRGRPHATRVLLHTGADLGRDGPYPRRARGNRFQQARAHAHAYPRACRAVGAGSRTAPTRTSRPSAVARARLLLHLERPRFKFLHGDARAASATGSGPSALPAEAAAEVHRPRVILVRNRQDAGTTIAEEVRARLLVYNNGPVWQIGNEIVTGMHADHIRFPELLQNLYSRPTMVWALENEGAARHRVEAAHLAGNLSWNADYVLTVTRDDALADLDGWVTLTNNSGTAFNNARLQLVAGDLHRIQQRYRRNELEAARAVAEAADASAFVEEEFSKYHLYSLGRRTPARNNETKQISLLTGTGVPVEKRFVVDGQQFYYRNQQHPGSALKDPVKVYFRFKNDEDSGLGMPLTAGNIRVYQADANGGVQLVGEDRVGHTPRDETLNLQIGNAFDVVAERKQTDFTRVSSLIHEITFEITLRNHKDEPIEVEVNEPIGGDWRMLRFTHDWTQSAAWAARFTVPAEAHDTTVLRYRVRVRR